MRAWPGHRNSLVTTNFDEDYSRRPTITRPLATRIQELVQELHLPLIPTYPIKLSENPPWKIPRPDVRMDLITLPKNEISTAIVRLRFLEIKSEYPEAIFIYTDGSKMERGVGCSMIIENTAYSWTLSPQASIFTAEQYAIWQALRYIEMDRNLKHAVVVSDSQAVLTGLQNCRSKDQVTQMCLETNKIIMEMGKAVTFVWVPGHAGIPGNERADKVAKQSTIFPVIDVPEINLADQKCYIHQYLHDSWQNIWQNSNTHLRQVKQNVAIWKPPILLKREDRVRIHRLRMGHTALTHAHLLLNANPPTCENCGVQLTIGHILFECPSLAQQRNNFKINGRITEYVTESEKIKTLILYLKSTGYYNKI